MKRSSWLAVAVALCATEACAHHRPASERARADLAAGAMVPVPGGRFRLMHGSGPLGDVPTYVSVDPFLLDTTEVTGAAYGECVRAGRCTAPSPAIATTRMNATIPTRGQSTWVPPGWSFMIGEYLCCCSAAGIPQTTSATDAAT